MGLFGSTKIYVSSTVYNLAGDVDKRPNFLKTLVSQNIIVGTRGTSMTDSMVSGYLNGPGIRIRNYGRWSLTNYPEVGVIRGVLRTQVSVDSSVVATQVPGVGPGQDGGFQR